MTPLEFQHALEMGFGRAIQHLKTHDPAPYEDAILEVCYADVKGKEYLVDVYELTGKPNKFFGFVRHLLLKNKGEQSDWDWLGQMYEMAKRGYPNARETLYEVFLKRISSPTIWKDFGEKYLWRLDGLEGLNLVLQKFGEILQQDYSFDLPPNLVRFAAKELDEELTHRQMDRWEQESNAIAVLMQKSRETSKHKYPKPLRGLTYTQVQVRMKKGTASECELSLWGETATNSDLILAAEDFLKIDIPEQMRRYLRIFTKRVFPFSHRILFDYVKYPDPQVAVIALLALEPIKHPEVRKFALQYQPREHEWWENAIGLFEQNYQEGDELFIEKCLKKATLGEYFHDSAFAALEVFQLHPDTEALDALLVIYENTRCKFCRMKTLKLLEQLQLLPQTILEECVFDASLEIRAWAKALLEARALA